MKGNRLALIILITIFVILLPKLLFAPSISEIQINSTLGTNFTIENITAYITGQDANESIAYDWRKNGVSDTVLNLPFDVNGSIGNTTNVKDFTSYGNNCTTGNGSSEANPMWNSSCGAFTSSGGCYMFDGKDDALDCGNKDSFNITNQITISVWVNTFELAVKSYIIVDKLSGNNGFSLFQYSNALGFYIGNGTGTESAGAYSPITTNTWYHVVGTYDVNGGANNLKVYVNGIVRQIATGNGFENDNGPLVIGAGNEMVTNYFNGSIDHVQVWNRTLSASEIAMIYSNGAGRYNQTHSDATRKGETWGVYVTVFDNITEGNTLIGNNITIRNSKPSIAAINLTPALPNATDDLNCTFTVTDDDADTLTANVSWYNNSLLSLSQSLSVTSGVQASIYLASGNTTGGDVWSCSARPYDEAEYGTSANASVGVSPRAYYVDNTTGNDTNDGLLQTTAWRTISKVNNASLRPGDSILFKRGGFGGKR